MSFIQIMECRTDDVEAIQKLDSEWFAATEGKRTLRRSIVARDRNSQDRYIILAFFDSYESAMANSELPETQEFAKRFGEFVTAPLGFTDLDVIQERD